MGHAFFKGVNWDDIRNRKGGRPPAPARAVRCAADPPRPSALRAPPADAETPPFVPELRGPDDTSHFDDDFDQPDSGGESKAKKATAFTGEPLSFVGYTFRRSGRQPVSLSSLKMAAIGSMGARARRTRCARLAEHHMLTASCAWARGRVGAWLDQRRSTCSRCRGMRSGAATARPTSRRPSWTRSAGTPGASRRSRCAPRPAASSNAGPRRGTRSRIVTRIGRAAALGLARTARRQGRGAARHAGCGRRAQGARAARAKADEHVSVLEKSKTVGGRRRGARGPLRAGRL